jgi:helicase MOV-10
MHSNNCPDVLSHGVCNTENCPHNHNIPTCEPCAFVFNTKDDYQYHLATNEHLSRTTGASKVSYCSVCQINVAGGRTDWMNHVRGHNHSDQAHDLGVSPNVKPQIATSTKGTSFCELCEMVVEIRLWNAHLGCANHISRLKFFQYKAAIEEAEADKHGVGIAGVFDFDCIAPRAAKMGVQNMITIRATRPHTQCILFDFKLSSSDSTTSTHSG